MAKIPHPLREKVRTGMQLVTGANPAICGGVNDEAVRKSSQTAAMNRDLAEEAARYRPRELTAEEQRKEARKERARKMGMWG